MNRASAAAIAVCAVATMASTAAGQVYGPFPQAPAETLAQGIAQGGAGLNPVDVLEGAADAAGVQGGVSGAVKVLVLLTVLSLAPSIMIMTTSFVRIIIVLGMLKQALGTQNLPPPQVLVAISLFMTFTVMAPTYDRVMKEAVEPYQQGDIQDGQLLWERARQPVRDFMFAQIDATGNWTALYTVMERAGVDVTEPAAMQRSDVTTPQLVSAFMLSELKTAFLMGFRVYLPFLVIDMVVASLLISMSMMMLPPVLVSMPFKLLLFVLVDGWELIVGGVMQSFATAGVS